LGLWLSPGPEQAIMKDFATRRGWSC